MVSDIYSRSYLVIDVHALGLQACLYLVKFHWSGGSKSNKGQECLHSRHDHGYQGFLGIHCYAGKFYCFLCSCSWETCLGSLHTMFLQHVFVHRSHYRFYNSILNLLSNLFEKDEVQNLLGWWNQWAPFLCSNHNSLAFLYRKIFPHSYREPTLMANSALAWIKERRLVKILAGGEPEPVQVLA